jgi:hypothetical protein
MSLSSTTTAELQQASRFAPMADKALRVAGGVIAVLAAVLTAVLELLLTALRIGGELVGISVVVAVAGNLVLGWFAYTTVGRKWAIALPATAWLVVMLIASGRTAEGDLLLVGPSGGKVIDGNSWVGITMIFAGAIAYAMTAFRLMLMPPPPLPPTPPPPPAASAPPPPPPADQGQTHAL